MTHTLSTNPTGTVSTELVVSPPARGTLRAAAQANNLPVTGTGPRRPPFCSTLSLCEPDREGRACGPGSHGEYPPSRSKAVGQTRTPWRRRWLSPAIQGRPRHGNLGAQRRKGDCPPAALVRGYRPAKAGRNTNSAMLCLLPGLYAVAHIAQGWIMGAMAQ